MRFFPFAVAIPFAALPLFASFIMLAGIPVPGVSLIPMPIVVGLLALVVCDVIYGMILLKQNQGEPIVLLKPLILWLLSGVLAAVFGFDPRGGLLFLGIFVLGIVWHAAIARFYTYANAALVMLATLFLTCSLACLAAMSMVLLRHPLSLYTIAHGRAVGTFVLPGELAGYLLMLVPIALGVAFVTKRSGLRIIAWTCFTLGVIAFAMTFSRTAFVAMGVEIAVAGILLLRGWLRTAALSAILAALGVTMFVFNAHHDPSENFTRLPIWQAAIGMIQRFPLTGVGPFNFGPVYQILRAPDGDAAAYHAHSVYLTLFAETGILGIFAFGFVWQQFARALFRRFERATPELRLLGVAWVAAFAGTLTQGLIDTVSIVLFGLWLPCMALALSMLKDGLVEHTV